MTKLRDLYFWFDIHFANLSSFATRIRSVLADVSFLPATDRKYEIKILLKRWCWSANKGAHYTHKHNNASYVIHFHFCTDRCSVDWMRGKRGDDEMHVANKMCLRTKYGKGRDENKKKMCKLKRRNKLSRKQWKFEL